MLSLLRRQKPSIISPCSFLPVKQYNAWDTCEFSQFSSSWCHYWYIKLSSLKKKKAIVLYLKGWRGLCYVQLCSVTTSNSIHISLSILGWKWLKFNITFKANKRLHKAKSFHQSIFFKYKLFESSCWQKSRLSKAVKFFHMGWLPYLFLMLLLKRISLRGKGIIS